MGEEPVRISRALEGVARGWGMESPVEAARLFARWEQIVGPQIAARCHPTSVRGGVLRVRTDSTIWASEFKYLSADLVRRINAEVGKPIVREVKPWVKPSVGENGPMPKAPALPTPATTKPTAQMAKQAAEVARAIPDLTLAEALQRALLASKISQGRPPKVVYFKDSQRDDRPPLRPQSEPFRRHP